MKKYICNDCSQPCEITAADGSDVPNRCPFRVDWINANWHKVDKEQTVTDCNQLPKLTVEVFDRPDCPEWAMYAAVHNGNLIFTDKKPDINEHGLFVSANDTARIERISVVPFKSNEHYFSQVIKRPAKKSELPDWCKVGEWVYHDSDGYYYTVKSVDIENDDIQISDNAKEYSYTANEIKTFFSPARLRPYNAEEMKSLIGKVICGNDTNFRAMIVYADGVSGVVETIHYDYNAEELAQSYTIDGKPCGKLVHKEGDDWVE